MIKSLVHTLREFVPDQLADKVFRCAPKYLGGTLYFGGSAILTYSIWGVFPPILLGVSFVTMMLRDLGVFLRTVQLWPVQQQVIDWEKVDQLLTEDDAANTLSPFISDF